MAPGPRRATASAAASSTASSVLVCVAVVGERAAQRPRPAQLGVSTASRAASSSVEVAVAHAGDGEQLGDDALVDGGVLAHVEPAQVGAERDHGAPHRLDERGGERGRAVGAQRRLDDGEVGGERRQRRGTPAAAPPAAAPSGRRQSGPSTSTGQGVQPGVHPAQRPPVRLVGAERRVVAGRVGEGQRARPSA